jgi:DNA repair protein RecN (Recombination protein N)
MTADASMIEELRLRGLGVIEDAVLPLGPGLTVVTGETGAGKTMVVTGLLLLLGGRADAARIRPGAEQATVDGRILLPEDSIAGTIVYEAGGELDDGAVIVRRVVTTGGRSRAYVGGAPAPAGVLAQVGEQLVTVHGQADQLRLARVAEQRAALDRYAGSDPTAYREAYQRWRRLAQQLADRVARSRELRREFEVLSHGIAEIEAAAPEPDEDMGLAVTADRLEHADSLRSAAQLAHHALLGDPDAAGIADQDVVTLLGAARRVLANQAGADAELDSLTERLADLTVSATELARDLAGYAERIESDPQQLAEVQARRALLRDLVRKYGGGETGNVRSGTGDASGLAPVLGWAADARSRLADLDVSDEALAALTARRDAAAQDAADLAAQLSRERAKAAAQLSERVTSELADLAMRGARVVVDVRRRPPAAGTPTLSIDGSDVAATADGVDDVEILLQPHPGAAPLPIARGASGGELSRLMLALEVCLAGTVAVPTIVFDEVDAGVGGSAATEVGRRLAQLAGSRQVVVVTHLAQVAAYADRHLAVDKSHDGGVTRSDVRVVEGTERVAELARMLGGRDSPTARRHAEELLGAARRS